MNEMLFFGFAAIMLSLTLGAFRAGKQYLLALIVLLSVLMNIFVTKQFELFGVNVTGGNVLYGAIFLATDLLSEHFGKKSALQAVWSGLFASVILVISTQFLLAFVPNGFDTMQGSLETLFAVTPRILFGSFLAYLVAQHLDVFLYAKIRKMFPAKSWLWLRNNGSTMISQLVDSIIFTAVGLTSFSFLPIEGFIPTELFWEITWATYIIKLIVAAIDTPLLYLSYVIKPKNIV